MYVRERVADVSTNFSNLQLSRGTFDHCDHFIRLLVISKSCPYSIVAKLADYAQGEPKTSTPSEPSQS